MLIGILSDTHDRGEVMRAAVELLRQAGAEYFIHCGDIGGTHMLDFLAGLPSAFVWGNNDWDRMELQRYAQSLGISCFGNLGELELAEKRFAVLHGDDEKTKRRILAEQQVDYLLQGHTHIPLDDRVGRIRCINPGALHRARQKTVAMLETANDQLTFLAVDDAPSIRRAR